MKILWKKKDKQFLLFSTIFCYLFLDFNVKTGTRFSLRDKRLFEISEVEITRIHCNYVNLYERVLQMDGRKCVFGYKRTAKSQIGPRGYKHFFMLSSAEH